jgi:hypothetical protein
MKMSGQLHTTGKSPRLPTGYGLGRPQKRSKHREEKKNLLTLPGIEPLTLKLISEKLDRFGLSG